MNNQSHPEINSYNNGAKEVPRVSGSDTQSPKEKEPHKHTDKSNGSPADDLNSQNHSPDEEYMTDRNVSCNEGVRVPPTDSQNDLKEIEELQEKIENLICENCGSKKKWKHCEVWDENGKPDYYECEIVRDDCNRNYRFKNKDYRKLKQKILSICEKYKDVKVGCGKILPAVHLGYVDDFQCGDNNNETICPNCKAIQEIKKIGKELK